MYDSYAHITRAINRGGEASHGSIRGKSATRLCPSTPAIGRKVDSPSDLRIGAITPIVERNGPRPPRLVRYHGHVRCAIAAQTCRTHAVIPVALKRSRWHNHLHAIPSDPVPRFARESIIAGMCAITRPIKIHRILPIRHSGHSHQEETHPCQRSQPANGATPFLCRRAVGAARPMTGCWPPSPRRPPE